MTRKSPPFELRAIDHVVLIVDGLEAAAKWRAEALGASKGASDVRRFAMAPLRSGAAMIDLVDAGSAEPPGRAQDRPGALKLGGSAPRALKQRDDHALLHPPRPADG